MNEKLVKLHTYTDGNKKKYFKKDSASMCIRYFILYKRAPNALDNLFFKGRLPIICLSCMMIYRLSYIGAEYFSKVALFKNIN